jgi:hypothetical protein
MLATARIWLRLPQSTKPTGFVSIVDLRGVEPRTRQCECRVIPLYYRPVRERHEYTTSFLSNAPRSRPSFTSFYRAAGSRSQVIYSPSLVDSRDPASRFGLLAEHRSGFRFRTNAPRSRPAILLCTISGRRESNPVCMTPSHVYYRHTPARFYREVSCVGPPGIGHA